METNTNNTEVHDIHNKFLRAIAIVIILFTWVACGSVVIFLLGFVAGLFGFFFCEGFWDTIGELYEDGRDNDLYDVVDREEEEVTFFSVTMFPVLRLSIIAVLVVFGPVIYGIYIGSVMVRENYKDAVKYVKEEYARA